MSHSYEYLVGNTYQTLLKDASFLSLIGGNVPEIVDESLNSFYIVSDSSQAELIFNKHTQILEVIIFKKRVDGRFPKSLNSRMDADEVRSILGDPIEIVQTRKLPVLGMVPPFDKFEGNVEVTYSIDTGLVEEVRFGS
ncbi:hypothetical protein [Vibrio sinaloensis]|uniref:hypothetical protein n=1 Tax=Photobacterium sp. (strain ATCC 43367) TaxID=379097 RepID=UPI0022AF613E|nr:hypothetical protein [Vibrio sinaloensis]MCZ4296224.1 hypothetical protein [Vibrio sinaloensis]